MTLRSTFKGWMGEKETQFGMWMKLGKEYIRFHDVIVPIQGSTTQIDHILLSRYGIFVIETKNINGWIFGSEKSKFWTQNLYGKKSKFQNPLHQSYLHTKALASHLQIDHDKTKSIVFFIGDTSEIKTTLPNNVMTSGLSAYIKRFQAEIFSQTELDLIQNRIKQLQELNISKKEHIANLKARHSKSFGSACPKCGGTLVKRRAKRGENAGKQFLGCSNFPKCKYTKGDLELE